MVIWYRFLFPALWLAWAVYWWLLSRNVKVSLRREPPVSRLLHIAPLMFAAVLLWVPAAPVSWLNLRIIQWAAWQFWAGAILTAVGLLFTVWARRHLGTNWSGIVTVKQNHELVTTGPYVLVRHPIYTGLLLAFAGGAMARGDLRGLLAVLVVLAALWRKLRLEEHWMREQFGDQYLAYSARVCALVPFLL